MGLSYRQLGLQAAALRSSPHLGNEGSSLSLRASNGTSASDTRHLAIVSATLDGEWQEKGARDISLAMLAAHAGGGQQTACVMFT